LPDLSDIALDGPRRLSFIREETRFEIGLLHDRVNALIGAEAFLTIAFATAMGNTNEFWGPLFAFLVAPTLSLTGLILAILAWPGIYASLHIIEEWQQRQDEVMQSDVLVAEAMWRRAAAVTEGQPPIPTRQHSMIFARAVPAVFGVAWAILTVIALALQL
jgi:hypothetical protein